MKTQIKIKIKLRAITSVLLSALCLCLLFGTMKLTAYADDGNFSIDAEVLSSGGKTYDISVTVENTGADWEGIARLKVDGGYGGYINCAYDTAVSLPQGSVKQFVVKVPKYSYVSTNISGNIGIFLIDKKSNAVFSQKFSKILLDEDAALNMGILSDDYSSLTFMDMGGMELDFYDDSYPIRLVELNQDNLSDSLETLDLLVIDKYDTGILMPDETAAIEQWNHDGGVLVVGTGKYAEDTLGGLDYLEIECRRVFDAGDNPYNWNVSLHIDKLDTADLIYQDDSYYEDDYMYQMLIGSVGDGSVGVLPYSLSELGRMNDDVYIYTTQSGFVCDMLDMVSTNANKRYDTSSSSNYNNTYMQGRFLSELGNGSSSLSFGALQFIIIVYVILAGPVLYLVLRFLKKRDWYWVTVPALALVGIIAVMFVGRGLEVVRTRVYSVTVCNLSDSDDYITYLHCYDPSHNEWNLHLAQDYEFAAPNSVYSIGDETDYDYRILQEGGRLSFGMEPDTGFEDAYFYAGKKADVQSTGGITCNAVGTRITNNTGYDFEYVAVIGSGYLNVYQGPEAGETCNLAKMKEIFQISMSSYYYYDYMSEAQEALKTDNLDVIAALGTGINTAYDYMGTGDIAVIGVTSDYMKAVDDNCAEEAYGCFYIIQ